MKTKLLVTLACHNADLDQASRLINWMGELDGKLDYPILIVVDQTVPQERYVKLFEEAKGIFAHARLITAQIPATGWKPNKMFLTAAEYIRDNYGLPWLWLEPDCVPLKPGWLEAIADAYVKSPLKYLGAIITQEGQRGLPARHLTGCSVYPADAFDAFYAMPSVTNGSQAWDIAGGEKIATASQNTPLIHHFWGSPTVWPVFVERREPVSPENHVMLDFIKPEAVLFHRDKESSLIPLLRKSFGETKFKIADEPPAPLEKIELKSGGSITDEELERLTAPEPPITPPLAKPASMSETVPT